VTGYITSVGPISLQCFDAADSLPGQMHFSGGNTGGFGSNLPMHVTAPGIRSCQFNGPDNQFALDDLTVHWSAQALTLTCPTSVVRGTTGQCVVLAPGSSLQVDGWSFAPAEIDTVLQRNDGQESDTTWAGPLVASGTVEVRVRLNGVPASASASIAVTARDWSTKQLEFQVEEVTPANLPDRPERVGQLGNFAPFAASYFPSAGTRVVPAGPNNGLVYFAEVPVRGLARIQINRVALANNSQFYLRQRPDQAPPQTGVCKRSDVEPFLPLVEAHEGLQLQTLSHAAVYRGELNARVPGATEAVVGLSTSLTLLDMIQSIAQSGIDSAEARARDQHNGGTVPPVPYHCLFRYF
jgi:hypothetical protein